MKTKSTAIHRAAWLFLLAAVLPPPGRADQVINDNLEVSQNLTVRYNAVLEGVTAFGKLVSQLSAGFTADVYQGVSTVEREEIIPEHYETQQVWVEDYGDIWTTIWLDDYGWVWRDIWVPDQYENGEITVPGYYMSQQFWEVIGGHSEAAWTWGVTGGHYESQHVWVGEQRNTWTDTVYGVPIIRHTGQRHDAVWVWRNHNPADSTTRDLLELSPAGLSIPHPDVTDGSARATLTSTNFEQSYTTPLVAGGSYQSYGVRLSKEKIEAWQDDGTANSSIEVSVSTSKTAQYKPDEVVIQNTTITGSASSETISTRIAAASAAFGGSVQVDGSIAAIGQNNTLPNQLLSSSDSILTRELADERYMLQSQSGSYLTAAEGDSRYLQLGPGGLAYGTESTAPVGSIAMGSHLTATLTNQVILGTYNNATPDPEASSPEVLVIGNGASEQSRSNALVIRRDGSAEIAGSLKVAGAQKVGGNLTVEGSTTLKGSVTAEQGAVIRILPAGDLAMAPEFQNGTRPGGNP